MVKFGQIWLNLVEFGEISCFKFGQIRSDLVEFGQIWFNQIHSNSTQSVQIQPNSDLVNFDHIRSGLKSDLVKFGRIWSNLIKFG